MSGYRKSVVRYTVEAGAHVDAWHRYSSNQQDDASALAAIDRYCRQHELALDHQWGRPATSGSVITGTREFAAFIAAMEERPETERRQRGILVWKFNRLGRDQNESEYYTAYLRKLGYALISIADPLTGTDIDHVLEAFQRWKGQRDLVEISEDSKRGLALLREDGYATGGFPPRGFVCVREQNKNHPTRKNGEKRMSMRWLRGGAQEEAVTLAWQLKARGLSNREIHEQTHVYKDQHCYHDMWKRHVYVQAGYVSEEIWQTIQAVMESRRQSPDAPRRLGSPYALSGLLYCHCGRAMRGMSEERHKNGQPTGAWSRGTGSIAYYVCPGHRQHLCSMGRIHAANIEQGVLGIVVNDILSDANLARLRQELGDELSTVHSTLSRQIAATQERQTALRREIANLRDGIARSGAIVDLVDAISERTKERDRAQLVLADLLEQQRLHNPRLIDDDQWTAMVTWMREGAAGDVERVRDVLRAIVRRVDVLESLDGVDITYTLGMSAGEKPEFQLVPRQGFDHSSGYIRARWPLSLHRRRGPQPHAY